MSSPASAGRTRFDIADLVRRHRGALEATQRLSTAQRRVLSAMALCRTAALGGHLDVCRHCEYSHPAYNSCRNRHCPKCQGLAQERWIAARANRLVPVGHFHVVFTLPGELRSLARFRPHEIFNALFLAASQTLVELGKSRNGALLGVTMVLHTWTRDLRYHPHVHALVTAGGGQLDGTHGVSWKATSQKYLFPGKVLGTLLRAKMMARLAQLQADGIFARYSEFDDPQGFDRLMEKLARKSWITYSKAPFREVRNVLAYLGRYTHRVAISNGRILAVTDDAVTFRTKGDKTATLHPVEFLRRFVQHVLPDGFHKIRHYGLYSGAHAETLDAVRSAVAPDGAADEGVEHDVDSTLLLQRVTGRDVGQCPRCGAQVDQVPLDRPASVVATTARAPPSMGAAA